MATVVWLSAGLVFSALQLAVAVSYLTGTAAVLAALPESELPVSESLLVWIIVGGGLTLVAGGTFGLWYWVRMTRRVPAYLDEFDERSPDTAARSIPTRPVGLLAPVTIGTLALGLTSMYSTVDRAPTWWLFAGFWPVYLLFLIGCVSLTDHRAPQPVASERWALPAAVFIQYLGIASLIYGLLGPDFRPALVTVLVVLLGLLAITEIESVMPGQEALGGYGRALTTAGLGVSVLAIAVLSERLPVLPILEIVARAGGLALVATGFLMAGVHWYDLRVMGDQDGRSE